MKKVLIGLVAAFLLASTVCAQCVVVRRISSCNGTICTPTIVTPTVVTPTIVTPVAIAVPVLVPAFQFQYVPPVAIPAGYVGQPNYAQGAYGGQPVVNQNQGYSQSMPAPGYGPAAPTRQNTAVNNQDKIRELAKALLEEMQRQAPQQGPQDDDDGPPTVPGTGTTSPPGIKSNNGTKQPPGLPQASTMSPTQAAPTAIAALQSICGNCHTGPASQGNFVMFAQPGLFGQNVPWRTIMREIDSGRMPPRNSQWRISGQQAAAVRAWLSGI